MRWAPAHPNSRSSMINQADQMRGNLVTDRVVSFILSGLIIALPFLTLLPASQPSRKKFKLGNNTGTRRGDFLGRLSTRCVYFSAALAREGLTSVSIRMERTSGPVRRCIGSHGGIRNASSSNSIDPSISLVYCTSRPMSR